MPLKDKAAFNAYQRTKAAERRRAQGRPTRLPHGQRKPGPGPAEWRYRRYGITEEQYQQMLADQGHACAICRTPFAEVKKVCVDHCHDKQHVRGILCDDCNVGLGRFKDDIERIKSALAYLSP